MAEGRGGGRRGGEAGDGGNAARCGDLAAAGEHLPALRLRPVGATMAATPCPRGCHHGAIRRRHRCRLRAPGRCRAVPGGDARAAGRVRSDAACGEDTPDPVRPLCGAEPERAWRRQTGDVQLPGVHPHLRAQPARRLPAEAEDAARSDASAAAGDPGRAATPDAHHARTARGLAAAGGGRVLRLSRRADQLPMPWRRSETT